MSTFTIDGERFEVEERYQSVDALLEMSGVRPISNYDLVWLGKDGDPTTTYEPGMTLIVYSGDQFVTAGRSTTAA